MMTAEQNAIESAYGEARTRPAKCPEPEKLRGLYNHSELERLIRPSTVAVIGASERPASFGARTLANLSRFEGGLFPINPNYAAISGHRCYPDLLSLPHAPDCVVAAVPRERVESVVQQALHVGAGGLIVYASGYAETGLAERVRMQADIKGMVSNTPLRVLGPNCLGILTSSNGFHATFANAPQHIRHADSAAIGLVSQSGALGMALVQAVERGVSFSHVLTSGNSCDVDVADLIGYLAADPACAVVACIFEGTSNPRRLLQAAEIAAFHRKPVLVYKIASGAEGAAAAMSHTGSLAGSSAGYDALFERAGFIVLDEFEALVETASFFRKSPACRSAGVGILSPSGGAAIMAADWAEKCSVSMPQPSASEAAVLTSLIPEFGSARNPCDVTAEVLNEPSSLRKCAETFLTSDSFGALVMPHITASKTTIDRTISISPIAQQAGKAYCVIWTSEWLEGPGAIEMEKDSALALFRSAKRCFHAISMWRHWSTGTGHAAHSATQTRLSGLEAKEIAGRRLADLEPGKALTESQAKRILQAYGVPVVDEISVGNAAEAVAAAEKLGYPVVMKVESDDILHKTEAGVVRLNLRNAQSVENAYHEILSNARAYKPGAVINGVLVQPMVPNGVELLVGGRNDPLFGSMIVVGIGGVLVELLDDAVSALAPVSTHQALDMLSRLRGRRLLEGFRGGEAADLNRIADSIARISELISDHPATVAEIDVNPLICTRDQVIAVDGLILGPVDDTYSK